MKKSNNSTMLNAYTYYVKNLNSLPKKLNECYNSYSIKKQQAYNYCLKTLTNYKGVDIRIVSHNCQMFSVGFIGNIFDGKTGTIRKAFFYITKSYDRYMLID